MAQPQDPGAAAAGVPVMDPALWRGLTGSRISRRGVLAGLAGAGAAAGLSGLLAACGTQPQAAATTESVGTASWWRKQRLHHIVNFANWPDYIDVLNGKHPTLQHFTRTTGISRQLQRADQREPAVLRLDQASAAGTGSTPATTSS